MSPNAEEITFGLTKRLGAKGLIRADYVRREYGDFYFQQTDLTTGQSSSPELGDFDLTLLRNDNDVFERVYDGLHTQFSYRVNNRLDLAGNWTWSHARGNYRRRELGSGGARPAKSGSTPSTRRSRSTSRAATWASTHATRCAPGRSTTWCRPSITTLSVSWLERFQSGTPYGALGDVDSEGFVDNPGYLTPPADVDYWYTDRDAFTTDDIHSSNLTFIYAFSWSAFGKELEIFVQPQVLNIFDEHGQVRVNTTVVEATNSSDYADFDPFTGTPVEGVNFDFGEDFGRALREEDFQQPRTYQFSVGFRF